MTPHINAKKEDIASVVLMPGDPLRAKFIAEKYLDDFKLVSSIRNMLMYTGNYKGKKISICGSGMGQPSIGIYSYELYKFYEVDTIIRIGSAGSYEKDLKVFDLFLATEAYSDSRAFNKIATRTNSKITKPSAEINTKIKLVAKKLNINLKEGRVHSSDVFYALRSLKSTLRKTKAKCVEMESSALFAIAKLLNKKAACLLTISDNLISNDKISHLERQNAFVQMMELALEVI